MTQLLWILLGGAIGTGCRFGVNQLVALLLGGPSRSPYATFIVNITGSFAIGLLAELFAVRSPAAAVLRAALLVGVLVCPTSCQLVVVVGSSPVVDQDSLRHGPRQAGSLSDNGASRRCLSAVLARA